MSFTFKLVMFSTPGIRRFASKSAEINHRYCARQGYQFIHEEHESTPLGPPYEKIRVLQKHLGSADYLFWLDSDACVIDQARPLLSFCEEGAELILAGHQFGFDLTGRRVRYELGGRPCGLNTGSLLLRSTDWSGRLLDAWWSRCLAAAGTPYYDQGHLQQMLVENALELQAHIKIVTPCSHLNRCDDNDTDVCDFVLHLWGTTADVRERVFAEILRGQKPALGVAMPSFDVSPA